MEVFLFFLLLRVVLLLLLLLFWQQPCRSPLKSIVVPVFGLAHKNIASAALA